MASDRSENPAPDCIRRRIIGGIGAALLLPWQAALARATLTDGVGRPLSLGGTVRSVLPAGNPAAVLLYTLAPDLLAGWPRANPADARALLLPDVASRPETGRLTGRGGTANLETILTIRPDLILDSGTVLPSYLELADRVQAQTGIPYMLFDGSLPAVPDTYRKLGAILGREKRAEKLARWAEHSIHTVRSRLEAIPDPERRRIYYGRGPQGLETGLSGSINVEILDFMGLTHFGSRQRGGLATVPLEDVLLWDPEVLFTIDPEFATRVRHDPVWAGVSAVRSGRVHLAPHLPFSWVDFPPSVNRLPGLWWLGKVVYPEYFPEDLRDITREFHALFYQVELSDDDVTQILGGSH